MRTIVNRALEEREATLRMHYDALLQEKLTEQFNTFARFNEDNIHRQMAQSTYDCMCFYSFGYGLELRCVLTLLCCLFHTCRYAVNKRLNYHYQAVYYNTIMSTPPQMKKKK